MCYLELALSTISLCIFPFIPTLFRNTEATYSENYAGIIAIFLLMYSTTTPVVVHMEVCFLSVINFVLT